MLKPVSKAPRLTSGKKESKQCGKCRKVDAGKMMLCSGCGEQYYCSRVSVGCTSDSVCALAMRFHDIALPRKSLAHSFLLHRNAKHLTGTGTSQSARRRKSARGR
jgi:hypothetical protein